MDKDTFLDPTLVRLVNLTEFLQVHSSEYYTMHIVCDVGVKQLSYKVLNPLGTITTLQHTHSTTRTYSFPIFQHGCYFVYYLMSLVAGVHPTTLSVKITMDEFV